MDVLRTHRLLGVYRRATSKSPKGEPAARELVNRLLLTVMDQVELHRVRSLLAETVPHRDVLKSSTFMGDKAQNTDPIDLPSLDELTNSLIGGFMDNRVAKVDPRLYGLLDLDNIYAEGTARLFAIIYEKGGAIEVVDVEATFRAACEKDIGCRRLALFLKLVPAFEPALTPLRDILVVLHWDSGLSERDADTIIDTLKKAIDILKPQREAS